MRRSAEKTVSDLMSVSVEYFGVCERLKEIEKKLKSLYEMRMMDEYSSQVQADINDLFERKKEAVRTGSYEEAYHRSSPVEWYDKAEHKTPFEIINQCFELYRERHDLKARKGALTRRVYLAGKSLS